MCDPATLIIASTAVAAVGQGLQTMQAAKQATYQARVMDRNAQLANESVQTEQENTRTEALRRYRELGALRGQQRAALAANGVDVDFGNAGQVQADAEMIGREDVNNIYQQGFQRSRGFEIEASNYRASAQGARQQRTGAIISGVTDIGTTVLGGMQRYSGMKAGRSPGAGSSSGSSSSRSGGSGRSLGAIGGSYG
jgi:hypothetical protein